MDKDEQITRMAQPSKEFSGFQEAQRTWVGLTDEEATKVYAEIQEKVDEHWNKGGTTMMFPPALYKAIEAKLKELNT